MSATTEMKSVKTLAQFKKEMPNANDEEVAVKYCLSVLRNVCDDSDKRIEGLIYRMLGSFSSYFSTEFEPEVCERNILNDFDMSLDSPMSNELNLVVQQKNELVSKVEGLELDNKQWMMEAESSRRTIQHILEHRLKVIDTILKEGLREQLDPEYELFSVLSIAKRKINLGLPLNQKEQEEVFKKMGGEVSE